jgi:uncharacterized protein YifN (PemK superfamily)
MEEIFTHIYETSTWGNNNNPEYNGSSGGGSELQNNINSYIPFVKHFIQVNNISSIVDLGCGDFVCGPYIYDELNVTYTGYDVYKPLVDYHNKNYSNDSKYNFKCMDIFNNRQHIVNADLCILKDVLQHWNVTTIETFLHDIIAMGKFKYILICNCCTQSRSDEDINIGYMRPLSCDVNPLKQFNPKKVCYTKEATIKEVSVISNENFRFMQVNTQYITCLPPVESIQIQPIIEDDEDMKRDIKEIKKTLNDLVEMMKTFISSSH